MTRWFRGRITKRLIATFATAGVLVTLAAAPAAAQDLKGGYWNPSGFKEGNYFFDDHAGSSHVFAVDSTPSGYSVWVRFQTESCYGCGDWSANTYVDDLQPDAYWDGRYTVGWIPPGVRFRIYLRFYNSNWVLQSHSETFYGYHTG